jgi:hypothetical protein
MVTNPEPQVSVWPPDRESSIAQCDTRRPDFLSLPFAHLLELQRGMLRVSFQQRKLFVSAETEVFWKR